jgi:thiamine pyrophosphate-dependent acetolactate synthase large subunit-like protein
MVTAPPAMLDRRAAVARLLRDRENLLVVTGLGSPSYDVHAAGDQPGNFYLWGAMGGAALVGLGLAQARPDRPVLVLTGDGEQLMGLGGLATIAIAAPPNLVIAVLDNDHYGETGMQRSHTGFGLDLAAIARAAGFAVARAVTDAAVLEAAAVEIGQPANGPRFYAIKVRAENLPRSLPPRDAVHGKNRLRAHLGLEVS